MSFSDKLKERTNDLHRRVDRKIYHLLKTNDTKLPLIFMKWYGLLMEHGISKTCFVDVKIDLQFDQMIHSLSVDRQLTTGNIDLNDQYLWLGAYYVVRGSANGGKIICKMLPEEHPMKNYFDYMGKLASEPWIELKAEIEKTPIEDQEQVILGASRAFQLLLDLVDSVSPSSFTTH